MPCIVILNSIHQDNFYGFLKLPVSPPFSAHPWPNTAIVPITCRKRAQNNEITVFRWPLGAGRRRHSRRESFPLNLIAKKQRKENNPPESSVQMSQ